MTYWKWPFILLSSFTPLKNFCLMLLVSKPQHVMHQHNWLSHGSGRALLFFLCTLFAWSWARPPLMHLKRLCIPIFRETGQSSTRLYKDQVQRTEIVSRKSMALLALCMSLLYCWCSQAKILGSLLRMYDIFPLVLPINVFPSWFSCLCKVSHFTFKCHFLFLIFLFSDQAIFSF